MLLPETMHAGCNSLKGFNKHLNLSFVAVRSPISSCVILLFPWAYDKKNTQNQPSQLMREVQICTTNYSHFLCFSLFTTQKRYWNNKSCNCNIRRQSDFQQPLWRFISSIWCQCNNERWAWALLWFCLFTLHFLIWCCFVFLF